MTASKNQTVLQRFLSYDPTMPTEPKERDELLHAVIAHGEIEVLEFLEKNGFDVCAMEKKTLHNAMVIAAEDCQYEVLNHVLDKDIDVIDYERSEIEYLDMDKFNSPHGETRKDAIIRYLRMCY